MAILMDRESVPDESTQGANSRRPVSPRKGSAFPYLVAASLVAVLAGFRAFGPAGFGFEIESPSYPGMISSGFLYNPGDNLSYVSWTVQARDGAWLFTDLYTVDDHPRAYFNPYFLAVGMVARLTGAPVAAVLIIVGIIAAAAVVVMAYFATIRSGFPRRAAEAACVFSAFASGLSGPLMAANIRIGSKPLIGADIGFQDAILT
ncbi:MAG: hypothetical protein V2B18_06390, partial [Pseudomonadota bacterium]